MVGKSMYVSVRYFLLSKGDIRRYFGDFLLETKRRRFRFPAIY
jgi:hypothetical protein